MNSKTQPARIVAAMENTTPSPGDADSTGCAWQVGGQHRRQWPRPLASGPFESPEYRALECVLSLSRTPFFVRALLDSTVSNRRVRTRMHGGVAGVGG